MIQTGRGRLQKQWWAALSGSRLCGEQLPVATAESRLHMCAGDRMQELGRSLAPGEKQCLARRLRPLRRRADDATTTM